MQPGPAVFGAPHALDGSTRATARHLALALVGAPGAGVVRSGGRYSHARPRHLARGFRVAFTGLWCALASRSPCLCLVSRSVPTFVASLVFAGVYVYRARLVSPVPFPAWLVQGFSTTLHDPTGGGSEQSQTTIDPFTSRETQTRTRCVGACLVCRACSCAWERFLPFWSSVGPVGCRTTSIDTRLASLPVVAHQAPCSVSTQSTRAKSIFPLNRRCCKCASLCGLRA